ncbi:MAG: ATP-binding cassette domain-containing protein [Gammaproteobacteria bacterium]
METSVNPVLMARGLVKVYRQGGVEQRVLDKVDVQLEPGERVALLGASGSGKSTLLHLLAGLDVPTAGEVTLAGARLDTLNAAAAARLRNRALGFVYQFHHLLMEFSAAENVALPLMIGGMNARRAQREARALLARVGLADHAGKRPAKLSGGERQRVAIARALATRPAVVLADEPTGNLDEATGAEVYELILELNREAGTAFVVATHDVALARAAGRILRLERGRLAGE